MQEERASRRDLRFQSTPPHHQQAHGKMVEPIHHAALNGDVAAIDRLVAEERRRLNAYIQEDDEEVDDELVTGCYPLTLAA